VVGTTDTGSKAVFTLNLKTKEWEALVDEKKLIDYLTKQLNKDD
jgi:anaerobic ribonucleoside-triphosphate reductase